MEDRDEHQRNLDTYGDLRVRFERLQNTADSTARIAESIRQRQDITNGRVSRLELRNAWLSGALGALGLVLGLPAVVGSIIGVIVLLRQ